MAPLRKSYDDNERMVVFPCGSKTLMDRLLLLTDPFTGELLQSMRVGDQFLRAGLRLIVTIWHARSYGHCAYVVRSSMVAP